MTSVGHRRARASGLNCPAPVGLVIGTGANRDVLPGHGNQGETDKKLLAENLGLVADEGGAELEPYLETLI